MCAAGLLTRQREASDTPLLLSPGLRDVSQSKIKRPMTVIGILFPHLSNMSAVEDEEQEGGGDYRNSR
jgi:hypothetical protein